MSDKHRVTAELLDEAARNVAPELVHSIAVSMASFIAAIDSDSNKVAAYIEGRLQPLIAMARTDIRCRKALEQIAGSRSEKR